MNIRFTGTPAQNIASFDALTQTLSGKGVELAADPRLQKLEDLYDLCQKFIDKQGITEEDTLSELKEFGDNNGLVSFVLEVGKIVGFATSDRPYEEAPSQPESVVEQVVYRMGRAIVLTEEQETGLTANGRELA